MTLHLVEEKRYLKQEAIRIQNSLGYTTLDMANFTIALGSVLIDEISNLLGVKSEKECGKPIWNKIN